MNKPTDKYKLSVGIECHVQLKTKTKLFSGANNDAREARPNTLVNHIDFGLPGALPVLNKQAIILAVKAAFALNSQPQKFSKFDRKHYFYPDLPMGYQITQYDQPIIVGGWVDYQLGDQTKRVNITRAHLEADAGKSLHPDKQNYSLVDLNRAGTPLLEIVSEPDMHSPGEAKAYAQQLYILMRYADVSEANLFYGNMRFDVNVSLSNTDQLGTRTETKNLNSFKAVEKAVEFEMNRQIKLLDSGQTIVQETRGWNDDTNSTYSMRSKENADDYRYMPDPDIPPVVLDDQFIKTIQSSMPLMPGQWRTKLASLKLDDSILTSLIFAEVEFGAANLEFLSTLPPAEAKTIANWIVNTEMPIRRRSAEIQSQPKFIIGKARHSLYQGVFELVAANKISSTAAKQLITSLLSQQKLPDNIEAYALKSGLIQNSNTDQLDKVVKQVLGANPKAAADVASGQLKAIGFLVGQVMKLSAGQANPKLVKDIITSQLGL